MKNYIEGNLAIINYYSKLYEKEIDIDAIADIVNNSKDIEIDLTNFQRFRVFLDSCLLLWNREKFERDYFKNNFVYQDFFDGFNNRAEFNSYATYITKNLFPEMNNKIDRFYFSLDGDKKRVWDQLSIVRNGLAHMQYGNFSSLIDGPMIFFGVYNKDKGVKKEEGYVLEPIFHDFVKSYYSNYTGIGVPFKHTWFSNTSLKGEDTSQHWYFHEVTLDEADFKYIGNSIHKMNELTRYLTDHQQLKIFLKENENVFIVNETKLSEIVNEKDIRCYVKDNLGFENFEVFIQTAKFILDPDTELSNFLVHLNQLNDRICDYLISKKNGELDENRKELILLSLAELEEDKPSLLTFKSLFGLLKVMNIFFRMQDDDYEKIDWVKIDTSRFKVKDYVKMGKFINKKILANEISADNELFSDKYYILERLRNSLMHGHIKVKINEKNKLIFVFSDNYNNRCESVEIESQELTDFSKQELFYRGLPNTVIFADKK
ncbi:MULTISPECIES: hypothetical protein [Enterococcus]|uniref:hypothetical protein n=1 Tax=Enterococcus TaxID=1350 RepID=UPI001141804C|nr:MULTISPECIES: hypothetical protein [Enterococcus]MDQ8609322.1 hypothetical protein [Enterococcus sp. FR088]NSV80223.1 hypothetical protein [Enterococcus faecalis]TQA92260.1 hypothetical protein FKY91_14190 [Enterococcus faecalis]UYY34784.1 hypothetical protein OLL95_07995 [Enterococcus faecalis]UYY37603.1 hypothetical protein OLL92_07995 [Enterococcus faecalis]